MIKTNTKKLCKAVDILRERQKRVNDVENGAYQMEICDGSPHICLQGEWSKEQALHKKLKDRMYWIFIGTVVVIFIILIVKGI